MSAPVVSIHVSHEVQRDQWCDRCMTGGAVTFVVWTTSESGVRRQGQTRCPQCEADQ